MANQNQNQNQNQTQKPYEIVDFLDLDTSCFSFQDCKQMKGKDGSVTGNTIGIRYNGKPLFVRYPRMITPFGIGRNTELGNKKNITGFNLAMGLAKEYEGTPVYEKAAEIEQFFIEQITANAPAWGLDDADERDIAGKDDKGKGGKWKRLLKWSTKQNPETKVKEYLDYPPRLEVKVPANITGEPGDQTATFTVPFFDADGNKINNVKMDSLNDRDSATTACPKFADVAVLAAWSRFTQGGSYGITFKPIVKQLRVYPREGIPNDECLLDDEDDGPMLEDGDGLLDEKVAPQPTSLPTTTDNDNDDADLYEDGDEEDEVEPVPAKPVMKRVVKRVKRSAPV